MLLSNSQKKVFLKNWGEKRLLVAEVKTLDFLFHTMPVQSKEDLAKLYNENPDAFRLYRKWIENQCHKALKALND